jgi:predicted transport protein
MTPRFLEGFFVESWCGFASMLLAQQLPIFPFRQYSNMAKSPEEMTQSMIQNYPANTGKTLDEWLIIIAQSNLSKHGEIIKFLKTEHGMGHGYANLAAHKHLSSDAGTKAKAGEDLVAPQYSGPKAALKPIYDALVAMLQKLGSDVEFAPKKAYVSVRRGKQFAIIQPSTATRVDVGINLKGEPATARLEASGSFNAMVSHRVRLSSAKEVDSELAGWMKQAYDGA